ncbi:MAG: hypothetical protein LC802_00240 [Acidobacteria bacterium]|nr:hypothetical protein [Acidobacteriota bacterium]
MSLSAVCVWCFTEQDSGKVTTKARGGLRFIGGGVGVGVVEGGQPPALTASKLA